MFLLKPADRKHNHLNLKNQSQNKTSHYKCSTKKVKLNMLELITKKTLKKYPLRSPFPVKPPTYSLQIP